MIILFVLVLIMNAGSPLEIMSIGGVYWTERQCQNSGAAQVITLDCEECIVEWHCIPTQTPLLGPAP